MEDLVIDTNVFVAACFNPKSASARVLAEVRDRRVRLVWNEPTRRETQMILQRIPRLNWQSAAGLFRPDAEFSAPTDPEAFALIADPGDRKFAALTRAANALLVTNDRHLLAQSTAACITALTPMGFLARGFRH
jgi:predicted nucleic acid-binding protein